MYRCPKCITTSIAMGIVLLNPSGGLSKQFNSLQYTHRVVYRKNRCACSSRLFCHRLSQKFLLEELDVSLIMYTCVALPVLL